MGLSRSDEIVTAFAEALFRQQAGQPPMQARIAGRIAELGRKPRLTRAEREELAMLQHQGPAARRVARSDEVPF